MKTVAVASVPPFFEPKARRKEYGGLEATATPAEVSFSNDPALYWRITLIASQTITAVKGRSKHQANQIKSRLIA